MTLPIDTLFLRHGQSEINAAKRAYERGEVGVYDAVAAGRHTRSFRLTALGRKQAEAAGLWLRQEFGSFDRYITSEYVRAMETSALLDIPAAQWFTNPFLTERLWGDLDSCLEREREEKFGDALRGQDIEPFYWAPPNGEPLAAVCVRLYNVLSTLHRGYSDKRVIMVCHGEVMWAVRVLLERMSQQRFKELHLSRASLDRMYNCQILHYTRRDPTTGNIAEHANWLRMIRPSHTPVWISPWITIHRPTYSNAELLQIVDGYPAVLK